VDSSEDIRDIRIKYFSCCDVLKELHVDSAKVVVVLTKYDNATAQKIDEICKDLQLENYMAVSSKTGYGIHKLKNMMKRQQK
jgi:GTP-binding protein HflX